ncbi:hypothetical protein [Simkania negevensis]|uniref:hypothetical protein n=1 Tax=Simkania negevensis TaxID=83561 RepID=UPI0011D239AC|nr:hypothetical protein [Simkania negevensis]
MSSAIDAMGAFIRDMEWVSNIGGSLYLDKKFSWIGSWTRVFETILDLIKNLVSRDERQPSDFQEGIAIDHDSSYIEQGRGHCKHQWDSEIH